MGPLTHWATRGVICKGSLELVKTHNPFQEATGPAGECRGCSGFVVELDWRFLAQVLLVAGGCVSHTTEVDVS